MSLQLNNPGVNFKEFYGRNTEQMPLLIAEGRTPLSAAGLMGRYLEVLELLKNAPKGLKPTYAALVKAWEDSYFDTGDGSARHSDGRMKVVPDAAYLRMLTPETKLVSGSVDLSGTYETLPGEEFTKADVDKYCGMALSRSDTKKNPVWLALARGDKALLATFVDARFARAKERRYNGKMMGVYAPPVPAEGAAGRLWVVGRLFYGSGSSWVGGDSSLARNGRLVGGKGAASRGLF